MTGPWRNCAEARANGRRQPPRAMLGGTGSSNELPRVYDIPCVRLNDLRYGHATRLVFAGAHPKSRRNARTLIDQRDARPLQPRTARMREDAAAEARHSAP